MGLVPVLDFPAAKPMSDFVTACRGRDWFASAEGATAPETLRQKDRVGVVYTLESRGLVPAHRRRKFRRVGVTAG